MTPRAIRRILLAAAICGGSARAQPNPQPVPQPINDLPNPYRTVRDWGKPPGGVPWAAVTAVEVSPDGSIYVIHRCKDNSCAGRPEPPILKFDKSGKLLKAWDSPTPPFPSKDAVKADHGKPKEGALDPAALGRQLAAKALAVKAVVPKLARVIEEAMAGTDCGDCGYPDCFGYSDAIAQGKDFSSEKCAPGGADSKAMLETILVSLKTGALPVQEDIR